MQPRFASIRASWVHDRDRLLLLIREFYAVHGRAFDSGRVTAGLVPLLIDARHGQVWIAEENGSAAGYAVVTWSCSLESGGLDCILDEIYVQTRGSGLGGRLLDCVVHAARDRGAAAMFLERDAPNDAGRRFYARHGFTAEDSCWMSRSVNPNCGVFDSADTGTRPV